MLGLFLVGELVNSPGGRIRELREKAESFHLVLLVQTAGANQWKRVSAVRGDCVTR